MHISTYFATLFLLSTCALAIDLSPIITFGSAEPAAASRVSSNWNTYLTHIEAQPAYTTWEAVIEDLKESLLYKLTSEDSKWYTRLPPEQQKYLSSATKVLGSIEDRDRALPTANKAPAETGAVVMVGAAVAGVLGVAAIL